MIAAALLFLRGLSPLTWIAAACAAAALTTIGVQKLEIGHLHRSVASAKADLAKEQAARATEHAKATDAALKASTAYRALEAEYQRNNDRAIAQMEKDRESNQRVVADLRRQLDGVRHQLAAFATGGRPATEDSIAACRDRASALGDVLAEALRVQGELASDAEDRAADARALLEAWPVTP